MFDSVGSVSRTQRAPSGRQFEKPKKALAVRGQPEPLETLQGGHLASHCFVSERRPDPTLLIEREPHQILVPFLPTRYE